MIFSIIDVLLYILWHDEVWISNVNNKMSIYISVYWARVMFDDDVSAGMKIFPQANFTLSSLIDAILMTTGNPLAYVLGL